MPLLFFRIKDRYLAPTTAQRLEVFIIPAAASVRMCKADADFSATKWAQGTISGKSVQAVVGEADR